LRFWENFGIFGEFWNFWRNFGIFGENFKNWLRNIVALIAGIEKNFSQGGGSGEGRHPVYLTLQLTKNTKNEPFGNFAFLQNFVLGSKILLFWAKFLVRFQIFNFLEKIFSKFCHV